MFFLINMLLKNPPFYSNLLHHNYQKGYFVE